MCRQCVRGGCASLEKMGAHPLIARLRQHVVPPQPPQLFSIRLPVAVRHINNHIAQPSTADMDGCRVVGPRGLCRPLAFPTKCEDWLGSAGRAQGRAGQGRAGQGSRAGQGRAGQGRAGQGRAGQGRAGQGRAAGRRHCSPRVPGAFLPSLTARPGASGQSLERPCK